VTVSGERYYFQTVGSIPPTSCNSGTYETINGEVGSVDVCARKCVQKGDLSSVLLLKGIDYDCDAKKCDCIYGTKTHDIYGDIKHVSGNKSCYYFYGYENDSTTALREE